MSCKVLSAFALAFFFFGVVYADTNCFVCDITLDSSTSKWCPQLGVSENLTVAQANSSRYVTKNGDGFVCVVGYSESTKQVYYQEGKESGWCDGTETGTILNRINQESGNNDGKFTCCESDGCNWSVQSALDDRSIGDQISDWIDDLQESACEGIFSALCGGATQNALAAGVVAAAVLAKFI